MHKAGGDDRGRRPALWSMALVVVGLTGLAITQPLLDLMGRNPEFFVAGRYTSSQIVQFALVVALVPSLLLVLVLAVSRLAGVRVRMAVFYLLLGLLGGLFGNVVARGVGLDGTGVAIAASVLGAAGAVVIARARAGRLLLQYLAVANVFFLGGFLFMSPTSELLAGGPGDQALGEVNVPVPPGPVVMIVFDELPISTLMRGDGTINADRYPAFARLAAESTWFRNTSSPHPATERAVPALVTGVVRDEREMPTYDELPRNLLALMSEVGPVNRYEPVTDLCPPDACEEREGQPLSQALDDSLVVYGHRVLPPGLRGGLAPIDDAWGDFGADFGGGDVESPPTDEESSEDDVFAKRNPLARYRAFAESERDPLTQAGRLVETVDAVDGTPVLTFVHIVSPHGPWSITPWGTRVMAPWPIWDHDPAMPDDDWSLLTRFQRHSWQTGAMDVALGQVLDHLESIGAWDDTTLIVTADHGTSTLPPDLGRRTITDASRDEVYRVPFFLKVPGQADAEVVDDVAMTTDVLPTIIDVLDIETDWQLDGHSLLDGSPRHTEPLVPTAVEPLLELARRHAAQFRLGDDWTGLAAVGAHGSLVGTPLADLDVGAASDIRWQPDNEASFGSLPDEKGEVPQIVTGWASTPDGEPPPALVVSVNGTIAGVTGGYQASDGQWRFSSVLGPYLVDGANEIRAYEVTGSGPDLVLHEVG